LGRQVDTIQLEESIEEVIKMDVHRSFPNNPDFDSDVSFASQRVLDES